MGRFVVRSAVVGPRSNGRGSVEGSGQDGAWSEDPDGAVPKLLRTFGDSGERTPSRVLQDVSDERNHETEELKGTMIVLLGTTAIKAAKIVAVYTDADDPTCVCVDTDQGEESTYFEQYASPEAAKAAMARFVGEWKNALMMFR